MAGRAQYSSGAGASANTSGERWIGSYKRLESIGKGSFAVVYKAVHPDDGSLLAIKSIQHTQLKGKLKTNLLSEIEIMRKAHHPHIVGLLEVLETPHNIHLVMEFCQLGDLATFVKKRDKLNVHPITADLIRNYPNPLGGGFNEVVVRHFAKQLASALEYLIGRGLIHRDLKPQNLLLVAPPSLLQHELPENRPYQIRENPLIPKVGVASMPCLKIADFGFARHLPQTTLAETLCGSPLYMAPEILRYEKYDNKADLWSVGIVLYELAVGRPPFKASNHVDLLRKIEVNMDRISFPSDIDISNDMKIVIRGLLKKLPTERISWENFFVSGIVSKDIPGLVASDRPKRKDPVRDVVRDEGLNVVREEARDVVREDVRSVVRESPRPSPGRRVSSGQANPETKTNTAGAAPSLRTRQYSASSSNPIARETPPSPASLQRYPASNPTPTSQQSRPAMASHAIAPVGQLSRAGSGNNPEMPRRRSQLSGLQELYPTSSTQEREEFNQRRHERSVRETREKAAHDVAFERDYVIVERRAVEINALADEMAATPHIVRGSYPSRRGAPRESEPSPLLRRATAQSSPNNNNNTAHHPSSSAPASSQVALRSDLPTQQRQPSYERRYGPGRGISATSALAAALNLVNIRIHGVTNMAELSNKNPAEPMPYPVYPTFPLDANAYTILSESRPRMDKDEEILNRAREGANRHDVVFRYAEVKYIQLLPLPPSASRTAPTRQARTPGSSAEAVSGSNTATTVEGTRPSQTVGSTTGNSGPASGSATVSSSPSNLPDRPTIAATDTTNPDPTQADQTGEDQTEDDDFALTPEAIVTVSEEGILLYTKALQILDNVMDLCGTWYKAHYNGPAPREYRESPQRMVLSDSDDLRKVNALFILDQNKFQKLSINDEIPAEVPVKNPFLGLDVNDEPDVVATEAPVIGKSSAANEPATYSDDQNVTASDNAENGNLPTKAENHNTFDNEGRKAVVQDTPEEARLAIEAHNRILREMKRVMFWSREQFNATMARVDFCMEKWNAARLLVHPRNMAHPNNDLPNGPRFSTGRQSEDLLYERAYDLFQTTLKAELRFGVSNTVFKEMLVTYKSVARMWEAVLETEGATWEEVKVQNDIMKEAVKNTPEGEKTVVTWKYPNDPVIIGTEDVESTIEFLHGTHLRCLYIDKKIAMRKEMAEEERRRGAGVGAAGRS